MLRIYFTTWKLNKRKWEFKYQVDVFFNRNLPGFYLLF